MGSLAPYVSTMKTDSTRKNKIVVNLEHFVFLPRILREVFEH